MKKIFSIIILLLLSITFASCANNKISKNAPELSEVKDRFVYLIEGSKEYNVIFFGRGFPSYDRDGVYAKTVGLYDDAATIKGYELVMDEAKFSSVEGMTKSASAVFGADYLESIGASLEDPSNNTVYTRYYNRNDNFYCSGSDRYVRIDKERIYDYSSMEIVSPSNESFVTVSIRSYSLDAPNEYTTFNLTFVKESGEWYLDSPTY